MDDEPFEDLVDLEPDDGVFLLYRMYRWGGAPLRYGITSRDFDTRFGEYCRDPEHMVWAPSEVDPSMTTIEVLGRISRAQAEQLERAAIAEDGGTLANDEFNQGRGRLWRQQLRRQKAFQVGQGAPVMPLDFVGAVLHRHAHVIVVGVLWVVALVVAARLVVGGWL